MALNGLFCADVPLRNYSLTHSLVTGATVMQARGHAELTWVASYIRRWFTSPCRQSPI